MSAVRMAGRPLQIAEVAARTELSLRTIRQYEDSGLVVPSAASPGGFPLYTDADVSRLMVVRRMKPLGFTLDETRELLTAVDRLSDGGLEPDERAALTARVRRYETAAAERVAELRAQLARAEEFADSLRTSLA
ncbi:DNA-binding transcriptional MerR regulator [Streptomyces sp. SFB5A]|uniref:DNA-binding transcriptional MerR regulator n=2 Tax=Streptomyces TaxID=1883 RepID=A0A7W7U688_9ACTN|nr:DNA-binding transcriptional MerR regulator [Streptomyces nymphaeiformis]